MTIRPSTALRNEYLQISAMAKATGEPIYITNKGEADGVFMSVEAFRISDISTARGVIITRNADGSVTKTYRK